ncbi:MAG TPA: CHASE2 domain-containing protein [Caldimonas sp.]|nr:CHASE2 domain-containing protein [Caldimonas sp.]HEX4235656.1 CHASE2 domain-containing protein [Caldimonas sp.]
MSSAAVERAEPASPKNVFISYRRDDNRMTVAVLQKALRDRPDIAKVFRDIDDIDYGDDFISSIDQALNAADVVLVIIGPRWAETLNARLGGDDWVRHEVAQALRLRAAGLADPALAATRLHVVPVLIGGAPPPPEEMLPADIAPLRRLSMLPFDERSEEASINTLLERIQGETFEQKAKRLEADARRRGEQARLESEQRAAEARRQQVEREHHEQDRKRRLRTLLGGAAAALALLLADWVGLLDYFNIDTRVATATMLLASLVAPQEAPWSGEVVLVGIDERSERALKRKFDTSWRAEHATLIANAASASARVVAFDLVLEDTGPDDANASLERSLAATRDKMPVVFGVQRNAGNGQGLMLPQIASLARQGINCAGQMLGPTGSMPLAVRRVAPAASMAEGTASAPDELIPSFALAAFSGGGRVEMLDKRAQNALVRLRPQRQSQAIAYYSAETIDDPQPACDVIAKGDYVVSQLIDPFTLPALRTRPQRVAYEDVVGGDPATLALLKNRIVLVGTLLPGVDMIPLPWPAEDRWGVELFAAQIDAMSRDFAIHQVGPVAELVLIVAMASLGAFTVHRLRERSRIVRSVVLLSIAVAFVIFAIAWYRFERRLIGVPYDLLALGLGAWLARRAMGRKPT